MPAPASAMIVTNLDLVNPIWAGGTQIAANTAATFTGSNITTVCADLNFWAAFLSGGAAVQLNGKGLPATTPAVVAFLIAVAIGDIVPT